MKVFTRKRTLPELKAELRRRGWKLDMKAFDAGSDHVSFRFKVAGVSGRCLFSTVNGRIFGALDSGERFSSDSQQHDGTEWFDTLLEVALVS